MRHPAPAVRPARARFASQNTSAPVKGIPKSGLYLLSGLSPRVSAGLLNPPALLFRQRIKFRLP